MSHAQVVPKLDGVDELLHMPLDEDCLQKLLSGDVDLDADLRAAAAKVSIPLHVACMHPRPPARLDGPLVCRTIPCELPTLISVRRHAHPCHPRRMC